MFANHSTCKSERLPKNLSLEFRLIQSLIWITKSCSLQEQHGYLEMFATPVHAVSYPMRNLTIFGAYAGHYKHYPINYKAAVTELLEKAALLYTQRAQPFYRERTSRGSGCNEISRSVYNLRKAALNSNESLRRVAIGPSDHFFLPSSVEYHDNKGVSSIQDEQKDRLVNLQEPPGINAHSVLGKMLFDVCVPKNVEDWDIKMVGSASRPSFSFSRRHSPFNPMKCIRRSRL